MLYAWDVNKAASNIEKHGVGFEAAERFDWVAAMVAADVRASYGEERLRATGLIEGRLHVMVFTIRRPRIWIISLRRANSREIKLYADNG